MDYSIIGLVIFSFILSGIWSAITYRVLLKLGKSYLRTGASENFEAMQLAVRSINVDNMMKVNSLEFELGRVQGELSKAHETNIYDITKAAMLTSDIEALEATNSVLKLNLASLNVDLERLKEDSLAIKVVTAEVATPAPYASFEFRDAVGEIIKQLGTPKTTYEIGVYNGVIAVANTLLEDNAYDMLLPIVEATKAGYYQMPERDTKGRFLKAVQ